MNFRGGGATRKTAPEGDLSKYKHAFTMAEVLITLGIIGIVAAMTLPSLIGKWQEKQWKVAYKKAYSSISQAFLRMQANEEFLDISDLTPNDSGVSGNDNCGENFKIVSNYFNAVKKCFDNNGCECFECAKGQAGIGTAPDYLGGGNNRYAFIDYSGMSWFLYSNREWPIIVDVNGFKAPNKLGKDRFVMKFAVNNSASMYIESANTIQPWDDIIEKQRWCPEGNCFYSSWLLE